MAFDGTAAVQQWAVTATGGCAVVQDEGGVLIDTQISGNGFYFGSYQVVSQIVGPSFAINNFGIIKGSSWSVLGQYFSTIALGEFGPGKWVVMK